MFKLLRAAGGSPKSVVASKILIGTHHKTGTVWFGNIFREIAARFGLDFVGRTHEEPVPPRKCDIFMNYHSKFELGASSAIFKGLHVVRDPRDQLVSATFYHEKSEESWLHVKRDGFGGLTYQEKLCSYSSFSDKLLFEMENSAHFDIMGMKQFDYTDNRFVTVKFEDMSIDFGLSKFEEIFKHLGFIESSMGWCLVSAYRNSLFSQSVKSKHVRSGKAVQWPEYFTPAVRARFEDLFGDVVSGLGYEERWDLMDR